MQRVLLTAAVLALTSLAALNQIRAEQAGGERAVLSSPAEISWMDGPPSLPTGAKIALLDGDPRREGNFCFRLKFPDAYRIPPHTHPKDERLTVISGTFYLGMGEKFDQKAARPLPAGSFGYLPMGMKHFGWSRGETVIQLHGTGPWDIVYLNPADDPRRGR